MSCSLCPCAYLCKCAGQFICFVGLSLPGFFHRARWCTFHRRTVSSSCAHRVFAAWKNSKSVASTSLTSLCMMPPEILSWLLSHQWWDYDCRKWNVCEHVHHLMSFSCFQSEVFISRLFFWENKSFWSWSETCPATLTDNMTELKNFRQLWTSAMLVHQLCSHVPLSYSPLLFSGGFLWLFKNNLRMDGFEEVRSIACCSGWQHISFW